MQDELASWTELIQAGMGVADFKGMSKEDADFLLNPANPRDYEYWLRLARNVPDDLCQIARTSLPDEVRRELDHRLNEIRISAGFESIASKGPAIGSETSVSLTPTTSLWKKTMRSVSAALKAFNETPTEWDAVDGSDFELPEHSLELVPKLAKPKKTRYQLP